MLTRNVAAQNKILKDCIAPLIDLKNHVIKRREASSGYLGKMMAFWTSKEYLRKMRCLARSDFVVVRRIARYLIHAPRDVLMHRWQDSLSSLTIYKDSNWAGCRETRKSTSGATFLHGSHVIKHYSRTQSIIALSSAEAELFAT